MPARVPVLLRPPRAALNNGITNKRYSFFLNHRFTEATGGGRSGRPPWHSATLNFFESFEKFPKVRTGSHLFGIKFKTVNEVKLVFDILRKLALPAVRWPEQDYFQLFREELLTSEVINLINLHIYIVTVDIYSGSKVSIDDIEFVKLEKELNATFKTRKN